MLGRDFKNIILNVFLKQLTGQWERQTKMMPDNEVNAIKEENIKNYISCGGRASSVDLQG